MSGHHSAPDRHRVRPSSFYRFYVADPLGEEWGSLKLFVRHEWHWLLLALAGVFALVIWARPLPPSGIVLAVGPENSALARLGERYVEPFARAGVSLRLDYTDLAGLPASASRRSTEEIDAFFLIGGMASAKDLPDTVSIGSVEYAPLWIFYRGRVSDNLDFFDVFPDHGFRIGLAGPVSDTLIRRLATLRGAEVTQEAGFQPNPGRHVISQFLEGELDVVAIVDGYDSEYVQQMIAAPDIQLFDMVYASAYLSHLGYLESVSVPRGALNMAALTPDQEVILLASTVSLLVDRTLHPAIQQLFLSVTNTFNETTEPFFFTQGVFPAYLDPAIPLSPVARRFYSDGGLALSGRLPYWLASLVDRLWLLLVGLLAILYPLYRAFPRYRLIRSQLQISDAYRVLREIDQAYHRVFGEGGRDLAMDSVESPPVDSSIELLSLVDELDALERHLQACWMSSDVMHEYSILRNNLALLRSTILQRLQK